MWYHWFTILYIPSTYPFIKAWNLHMVIGHRFALTCILAWKWITTKQKWNDQFSKVPQFFLIISFFLNGIAIHYFLFTFEAPQDDLFTNLAVQAVRHICWPGSRPAMGSTASGWQGEPSSRLSQLHPLTCTGQTIWWSSPENHIWC